MKNINKGINWDEVDVFIMGKKIETKPLEYSETERWNRAVNSKDCLSMTSEECQELLNKFNASPKNI